MTFNLFPATLPVPLRNQFRKEWNCWKLSRIICQCKHIILWRSPYWPLGHQKSVTNPHVGVSWYFLRVRFPNILCPTLPSFHLRFSIEAPLRRYELQDSKKLLITWQCSTIRCGTTPRLAKCQEDETVLHPWSGWRQLCDIWYNDI